MEHCRPETAGAEGRPPWIARTLRVVAAAAAEVGAGLSRAAMDRRVLHRLSMLSERELKDIGLTPQDVADAAVRGTGDAADLLIDRRDARRRARVGVPLSW
ncbi:DUF1127 domain-containing protein [Methylobacterium sp. NEAU K]|uniref:DUF1127 domain-containing protein n=1 Tax=Methylobacterium sp. NEAU K TaxID=3064946 RepID=UPI0027345068|nr:DUF1127 domain-containing protein [Methylobacterium sp. NEAU K]MDP4002889.1 DUF1127 domain-containing protein [Methylobacterium sp. NEAU K]